MQLIGQAIRHKVYGKGIVTSCDKNIITVCFSAGNKRFIYPDAFTKHLTLKNKAIQGKIQALLDVMEAQRTAERRAAQEAQERQYFLQNLTISRNSQAAFHLTEEQAGTVFTHWTVSTGNYLSGYSKGEPRVPDRVKPNSLCLLTHRAAGGPEGGRRIIGAFMAAEDLLGNYCLNGIIPAHPTYRIALKPEAQPLFWTYFSESPAKQRWGRAVMKYFANETAGNILFDLWSAAKQSEEREALGELYRYFCRLNRLPPRERTEGVSGS